MVAQATNGTKTSLAELTSYQAKAMITNLLAAEKSTSSDKGYPVDERTKMQRTILSMAHQINWKLADGKVDMAAINTWCQTHGYLHKKFNAYSYDELPKLVHQFGEMMREKLRAFKTA